MKDLLKGRVIALTGSLPQKEADIRTWIERAGGRFTSRVTSETTHLVASLNAYEKCTHPGTYPIYLSLQGSYPSFHFPAVFRSQ